MTISELIVALERVRARHGDVRVAIVGTSDDEGDEGLTEWGVHTAPWVREPGGEVVCCLDVTSSPELVTDADLA